MPNAETLLQDGWRESRQTINGLSLHIVEAGRVGDPLLVLLHGFPEFWWAWRYQITPLARAGYHVVIPDMRGYNTNDAPQDVSAYTLDVLAADVVGIADAFSAERFDLVGHDWGAVIGWWVTAQNPDRLKRVVLMDGPHPDVFAKQVLAHPTQALRSTYMAFFQLPWVPEAILAGFDFASLRIMMRRSAKAGTFEPGAVDQYARAWAQPGSLTAMLNYYRAIRRHPRAEKPARLTPATLVLWGADDLFLEAHIAEASVALCDNGKLEFVEGASHWLHIEQPGRINSRILDWLADGI